MNAQDFQKAMADVMRRQQQGLPPITTAGQIDAEINKPMSSGMMSAYVDTAQAPPPQPSGSVDGRQASADKQRGIAKSLRGGAAPKGMTAGPYNVYYGPNIGESIGEAGKHLMAGYVDMKANEKDAAIDIDRQAALEKAMKKEEDEKAAALAYTARRDGVSDAQWREQQDASDAEFTATHGLSREKFQSAVSDKTRSFEENVRQFGVEMAEKIRSAQAGEANALRDDERAVAAAEQGIIDHANDRDYISVANPDGSGMTTIRQGDDIPEGMILANAFFDQIRADGTGAAGAKSSTQRIAEYRANSLRTSREQMQLLLDSGYSPSGWEGFKDKITNSSDLTRWAASPEGKKFQSAQSTAKEALLRTATGAAAPDGENREYIKTLIPSIGDGPDTIRFKMGKLTRLQEIMDESAGITNDGEAEMAWMAAVSQLENEEIDEEIDTNLQRATNPETGEVLVLRNGNWEPE